MTDIAIKTDKLTRDFNGIRAVDSLSLQVPRGSIFGFLGPNGAGKTTTIRLLLGLLEPSSGRASLLGFDTVQEPSTIRAMSGALLENHGLYEKLSAQDNLEFYGRIFRLSPAERQERIKELLTRIEVYRTEPEPECRIVIRRRRHDDRIGSAERTSSINGPESGPASGISVFYISVFLGGLAGGELIGECQGDIGIAGGIHELRQLAVVARSACPGKYVAVAYYVIFQKITVVIKA